jgi:hypothetical protein
VPAIDLLTGSPAARAVIEAGEPLEQLFEGWSRYVGSFEETLAGVLLYHEA